MTTRLGQKLGEGAGGTVYRHPSDPSLAIKVLSNPRTRDVERINAALSVGIPCDVPNSTARLAWPKDLYRGANGDVHGFVMPIAAGTSPVIAANLMNRSERRALAGNLGFNLLVHYAAASCALIGHYHDYRIVVGDLNERNLMVSGDGWVTGIDADSAQFTDAQGNEYLNGYHTPEFLAPELVGVDLASTPRQPCQDDFALAVIVFMLLCDGWHPFVGIHRNKQSLDQIANASKGHFAYPGNCTALSPPKGAPPWEVIPRSLADPLEQTFTAGTDGAARVPAWELHAAAIRALKELVLCDGAEQHYYPREQPACPWCSHYGTIRVHATARSPRVGTHSKVGAFTAGWVPQPQAATARTTPRVRQRPVVRPSPTILPGWRRASTQARWILLALAILTVVVIAAAATGSSAPGSSPQTPSTPSPTPSPSGPSPGSPAVKPPPHAAAAGPSTVIAAHLEHIARGQMKAAFELFSPSWRASHPGWLAQRAKAQPRLEVSRVGPAHIDGPRAVVYVSFVAHDTVAVSGSDTRCRRFRGWAHLVAVNGAWRYEPDGAGLTATVLPSSLTECR